MRFRGAFGVVATALLVGSSSAHGATMTVETDGDDFGGPSTTGVCTLREAVEAARTNKAFGGCPKGSKTKRDTVEMIGDAVLQIGGDTATNADGDLDYDKGGKLTILGDEFAPDRPTITQNFSDRILEITHQKGVRVVGVEMQGGGSVNSGGAVRASQGAALTLQTVNIHDNVSELRGGAVACEGCKSLRLKGAFQLTDNLVQSAGDAAGGALWSNAPTVAKGVGGGAFSFDNARITQNTVNPGSGGAGRGGAIFAGDDLTVTDTRLADNVALGHGYGGAIAMEGPSDEVPRLSVKGATLEDNTAEGRGGAIETTGTNGIVDVRRSAIIGNRSQGFPAPLGTAFGGGVFTQANARFVDTVVAENQVSGDTAGDAAQGAGIYMNSANSTDPQRLTLIRTSVTENDVFQGGADGGGIFARGSLRIVNSTISGNSAPGSGGDGGGILTDGESGAAEIHFSTLKGNVAGDDGNGIYTSGPPVSLRGSILDHAADNCAVGTSGEFTSGGFNVEEVADPDCGLDAATDVHAPDLLSGLSENGSPPVGFSTGPLDPGVIPLTHAFTNDASAALDLVPTGQCEVDGKRLRTDARGVPRPAEGGCEAGAIERTSCLGEFVVGPDSYVGRKSAETIQGSSGADDVVLAQAGDDLIGTYNGADSVCAGKGDDLVQPQAGDDEIAGGGGIDTLNYNNAMPGGISLDLADGVATGPTIGTETFTSIEQVQGSEDGDELYGDAGPNLIIGGGNPDLIRGRGGIDVINAQDGVADVEIDCGPGDNSKEKAKIDEGLDPAPQSC